MQRTHSLTHLTVLTIACALAIGGSCDRTNLTGTIRVDREAVSVGEAVELDLELPESLSGVYWIIWHVDPSATLEYVRLHKTESEPSHSRQDRHATFVATHPGDYVIRVEGVYRQTNFQPIASIVLTVRDRGRR